MKKNVLVGQSGGPTAVINASLYGVITESIRHGEQIGTVYGMENGIGNAQQGGAGNSEADSCRLSWLLPLQAAGGSEL